VVVSFPQVMRHDAPAVTVTVDSIYISIEHSATLAESSKSMSIVLRYLDDDPQAQAYGSYTADAEYY